MKQWRVLSRFACKN